MTNKPCEAQRRLNAIPEPGEIQRLIGIDELSAMLGIAKNTLYDWCALKKIPHIKLGKLTKFKIGDIDTWLAAKKQKVRYVD